MYTIYRREQIEIEHNVRRRYPSKWGEILQDERIQLYSHANANAELRQNYSSSQGTFFNLSSSHFPRQINIQ